MDAMDAMDEEISTWMLWHMVLTGCLTFRFFRMDEYLLVFGLNGVCFCSARLRGVGQSQLDTYTGRCSLLSDAETHDDGKIVRQL